jgi:hypothetical protein
MANAEKLLNQAQYAFQSINYGESRDNRRNASRATSLCKKIIRKFPTSSEAAEAHAILKRLGDEAYTSKMSIAHRHMDPVTHHTAPTTTPMPTPMPQGNPSYDVETAPLDWRGLLSVVNTMPKMVVGVIIFVGVILFGFIGAFLFLPLIAFVLLTGPFRQVLNPKQCRDMNMFVTRANAYIEERRKSNNRFT